MEDISGGKNEKKLFMFLDHLLLAIQFHNSICSKFI